MICHLQHYLRVAPIRSCKQFENSSASVICSPQKSRETIPLSVNYIYEILLSLQYFVKPYIVYEPEIDTLFDHWLDSYTLYSIHTVYIQYTYSSFLTLILHLLNSIRSSTYSTVQYSIVQQYSTYIQYTLGKLNQKNLD